MMNGDDSRMVANRMMEAASEYDRPSTVHKPRLFIDGDHWCALHGENLQDGIAGFGKSPHEAMQKFDDAWYAKLA